MSRTIKGAKGSGYEYWSRRANGEGTHLNSSGRYSKKTMNRAERHRSKQKLNADTND